MVINTKMKKGGQGEKQIGKEMLGKWSKKASKRVVFAPRPKVEGKQHR